MNTIKLLADASLPLLEALFPAPFSVTPYTKLTEVPKHIVDHDVLLCRSTLEVNKALLDNTHIQCVASASSGIDHIDTSYCKQRKITLLDAKGCNKHAVGDYMLSTIATLQSDGTLKDNSCIGIIGMGKVGTVVAERLSGLGFNIMTYDPIRKRKEENFTCYPFDAMLGCDVICIHANLHDTPPFPSLHLFNERVLNSLKPGVILINAARGSIVDESALLRCRKTIHYCTDVYENEPHISPAIIDYAKLCTPHIAGHSVEAKQRAVYELSRMIHITYGLPSPNLPEGIRLEPNTKLNKLEKILDYYDPIYETISLKRAKNKMNAFLTLRKAHATRHELSVKLSDDIACG